MITEQQIIVRLEELKTQAEALRGNLNAIGGAIQDCEYWLEQIKIEPEINEIIK
jgi:prefoldin subunit 5